MKIKIPALFSLLLAGIAPLKAQQINEQEVSRIISVLAADSLQGRNTYSPGIEKASLFIESEFAKAGLMPLPGAQDFRQRFATVGRKIYALDSVPAGQDPQFLHNVAGMIKGSSKPDEYVIFSAHYDHIGILKAVE